MSELDITNGARFGLIYILSTLELGNLKKDFSITCIKNVTYGSTITLLKV